MVKLDQCMATLYPPAPKKSIPQMAYPPKNPVSLSDHCCFRTSISLHSDTHRLWPIIDAQLSHWWDCLHGKNHQVRVPFILIATDYKLKEHVRRAAVTDVAGNVPLLGHIEKVTWPCKLSALGSPDAWVDG